MLYFLIAGVLKLFVRKPKQRGREQLRNQEPAVYAANHLGYYSPIKLMLYSGLDPAPWVNYEITQKDSCREYLRLDFVEPTLNLKGGIGRFVAAVIAPLCIGLMRRIRAIPVYHGSRRIVETFDKSVAALMAGRNLLIFPEFPSRTDKVRMQPFQAGFVRIAKDYYAQTGKRLRFYPVWVDRKKDEISFGEPLVYDPESPFSQEKLRISEGLRDQIRKMSGQTGE